LTAKISTITLNKPKLGAWLSFLREKADYRIMGIGKQLLSWAQSTFVHY